jgi:sugar lactone lactonase YvrE
MKTLIKKALCVGMCSLLTMPAAAGAHARIPCTPLTRHALGQATPRHPERSITAILGRLHHSATASASATAHFNAPDAVATDAAGDVYVANEGGNDIEKINAGLTVVKSFKIKDTNAPISLAVDSAGNIYAGSGAGGVEEFTPAGAPEQSITANASDPDSLAVDQFDDLYIAGPNGLAIDGPDGVSIWSSIDTSTSQIDSVAIGGATVHAFYGQNQAAGNGSVALRDGSLQYVRGPYASQDLIGSACAANGTCWLASAQDRTLTLDTGGSSAGQASVSYVPTGVAYDGLHNRVFVADPQNNAVHVYNSKTLALIKTIS